MENLTLETLPKAIVILSQEISEIKALLLQRSQTNENKPEQLMSIQETAKFLNLSTATIYSLVSRGTIPCMKRTKRLYFSTDELTEWLKTGRKLTFTQSTQTIFKQPKRLGGNK